MNVTFQIKIYSQLAYLKKHTKIEKKIFFFEKHESTLESIDVTICKAQNSDILILKLGKVGLIEYVDKEVFTTLTYLGFHLEHKVNKYIQMFQKFIVF